MVILSHIRSRISRPESGSCMTRTTAPMSLFTVSGPSSSSVRHGPSSASSRGVGGSGRTALPTEPSQRPGGCGPPTAQWTPHQGKAPPPSPEPTGDASALPAPASWAVNASSRRAGRPYVHTCLSLRRPWQSHRKDPWGWPGSSRHLHPHEGRELGKGVLRAHTRWHCTRLHGPGSSMKAQAGGPRCAHTGGAPRVVLGLVPQSPDS